MKDIEADTVHSEFKTDNNKLSIWAINNDDDFEDAVIALGSNCSHIVTMQLLQISEEDLKNMSIETEEGNTPTNEINQKHRNITDLNFESLGELITVMIRAIGNDKTIVMTKSKVKELLKNAYFSGKINMELVSDSLREEIMKIVQNE